MRLSLMIASRPVSGYKGTSSRIPSGNWKISCLDIKDSVIAIETRGSPLVANLHRENLSHVLVGPETISLSFLSAGTEKEITVIAEKLDGP